MVENNTKRKGLFERAIDKHPVAILLSGMGLFASLGIVTLELEAKRNMSHYDNLPQKPLIMRNYGSVPGYDKIGNFCDLDTIVDEDNDGIADYILRDDFLGGHIKYIAEGYQIQDQKPIIDDRTKTLTHEQREAATEAMKADQKLVDF